MSENWEENEHQRISFQTLTTDAETGEPEIKERIPRFRVPRGYLQEKSKTRRKPIHGLYWRKQEIRSNVVKEFGLCKRQNVSTIVFMIPTLFICPGWASILCLLGEACMHIWSHRRNSKKKNADIEYRSPFHLISSQFCIHCRSQKWMEKISQIQDKRNLRRRILYPNTRGIMAASGKCRRQSPSGDSTDSKRWRQLNGVSK